jgi:predicted GIY-YIG superfamily endonuclease
LTSPERDPYKRAEAKKQRWWKMRKYTTPAAHRDAIAPARQPLPPVGRAFCCYILGSDSAGWAGPYTGKTCDLRRRLHRHNHPSARSRAYTKGKGPWRVAAAVFGLRTNRQSVWLERALKRHAKRRACPAGLGAVQSAALAAVHVASRPGLWWVGSSPPPTLRVHVFRRALQPTPRASPLSEAQLRSAARVTTTREAAAAADSAVRLRCHPTRDFLARTERGG